VDRSLPPAQSLSQGPSTSVYNANLMTSVMRLDPIYELALASQVPHTQTEHPDTSAVAVTCFVADQLWFMTRIREEEEVYSIATVSLSCTVSEIFNIE